MAIYHFTTTPLSRGTRNTVQALAYRAGCKLYDDSIGQTFNYQNKTVEHVELLLPKDAPAWAIEIQKVMLENRSIGVQAFCDVVESAEKRIDARVWREFEFALHRELTHEQNIALAREFVSDQICSRGMAAQLNFHFDVDTKTGEAKPHCHVIMATRRLEENGWGIKKEEVWNKKEFLQELRVQWQEYSNFHLKLNGHDVQIDHRCNKDRGIEAEPQPKMGRGVRELENRLQKLEEDDDRKPITDKAKEFHDVQLRNLYRIMRRPEVVLDIVSKHHSTFMWADIQKVLHRYVDELPLFQRLEAKLKSSNELMLLKADPDGNDIYTTRTMLQAEKSLVENAEALGQSKSHGVQKYAIHKAIAKADRELKAFGGLSQDQKKAVCHLADEGQLKCVVGIAGAGKTTALSVCQDIWQAEGYAVYGLAPTGKAAQNLEQGGISAMTLHKFLKEFAEGRCQYSKDSVLVLDEAGMVDMERFEKLLGTLKQLGAKLIVVGDGAQLQPVEAGPAFRLVTTRLGKSELNTVLRQKEDWQKEATVLFGRQQTQEAIREYADKGHVHIVEEALPIAKHSLYEDMDDHDREAVIKLYEISSRTSSLMYREMMKDVNMASPQGNSYQLVTQHQDFERYQEWKNIQKSTASQIITDGVLYLPLLEERSLDSLKMAMLFVDPKLDKETQAQEAIALLQQHNLSSLSVDKRGPRQAVDMRTNTKEALVKSWLNHFKGNPDKTSLMLAFSNRDVKDLNTSARMMLKESGHIDNADFTYTISKRIEDDFGKEHILKEEKVFAKGDRIVFTRNTKSLGVKNGTMGTITVLNKQNIQVKLDAGKEISFAPNLNPYFDQGWAITIHKSQGTTVDQTYVLASFEMTQNLAYVAMTRHRENVQVFGSNLDFWRPEKLPEVLSKSGEKLSPGDYLDADSLNKLMQEDDHLLTKIFNRVSNELEAMGAVSRKAFWQVADQLIGTQRDKEIRVNPDFANEFLREEMRAEELLRIKSKDVVTQREPISQNPEMSKGSTSQITQHLHEGIQVERPLKQNSPSQKTRDPSFSQNHQPTFANILKQCEQRLHTVVEQENIILTPERAERIALQAERMAIYTHHAQEYTGRLPSKDEMINIALRAKLEVSRLPHIQQDLMDQGEDNIFRAYRIADRLASIEGRLYFEALQKGTEPPFNTPFMARRELDHHREELPHLVESLMQRNLLSEPAASHCAQDILRYREIHNQDPTSNQMEKIIQIAQRLEDKEYKDLSGSPAPQEQAFLRRKEGDLLLRHGLSYDASSDLDQAQFQAKRSLELLQRQMENDRLHTKQMDLGL